MSNPKPLVPGQAQAIDVDLLPTAYVFQSGHRLRLALAGAASVADGLPFPQGPGANPAAFTWTVMQDAEHPATLTLPVVGTAGRAAITADVGAVARGGRNAVYLASHLGTAPRRSGTPKLNDGPDFDRFRRGRAEAAGYGGREISQQASQSCLW